MDFSLEPDRGALAVVPPDAADAALSVRGVSKRFGATKALADVTFDVARGSIHALLGANGSGKSTLIKVLAGVGQADSGAFFVHGREHDATSTSPEWAHAAGMRFVHQPVGVFPDMTVAENMVLGPGAHSSSLAPVRRKRLATQVETDLRRFDIEVDPSRLLGDLSSVEQAMIAVARAFRDVGDDGILVLDEPTAAMPQDEVELLLSALRGWAGRGHAIIIVSHRLQEIRACADFATFLRDGQVLDTVAIKDLDHDSMINRIAGSTSVGDLNTSIAREGHATGLAMIEIRELSGGALQDLTMAVGAGEILGVSSLVGSGGTQIFETIFGVRRAERGHMSLGGDPYEPRSPHDAVRADVAYVPSDRRLDAGFMNLSIRENLWVVEPSLRGNALRVDERRERRDAEAVVQRYNVVTQSSSALLSSLSGGNQQKVIISRWLERKPRLLLLDEPTQGVDVGARGAIHRLVRAAAAEGTACIVASSDPKELVELCDRVVGFSGGRLNGEVRDADLTIENCLALAHTGPSTSEPQHVKDPS